MIKDYFTLAYQSAKKRKLRSWLTMVGIFIGIAAVVALVSLSQGLQGAIEGQFMKLGSDKLIISAQGGSFGPSGTAVSNPLTISDKELIEDVKGVDTVVGRLIRTTKLEFKGDIKYSYVISLPNDKEEIDLAIEANDYQIDYGRLIDKSDKYKVMVGSNIAEDYFEDPIEIRDSVEIQGQEFEVVGILKKSGNPQQDNTMVLPENGLREILNIEDEYDIIPTKVSAGEDIDIVSERISAALRKSHDVEEGKEDFGIETPEGILNTLNNILMVIQGVLVGIAAISLLVGGIGIMNTMYTSVHERTKEIGIMKALGARNKNILLLFLIESGFLGLLGGIIGVSLGYGIAKTVEYVAFQYYESVLIQAQFSPVLLIGMLLFAFSIGAVSGMFPARQAAKLKPVDALRK